MFLLMVGKHHHFSLCDVITDNMYLHTYVLYMYIYLALKLGK